MREVDPTRKIILQTEKDLRSDVPSYYFSLEPDGKLYLPNEDYTAMRQRVNLATRWTVAETDTAVLIWESTYYTDTSPKHHKRYFNWETTSVEKIGLNRRGQIHASNMVKEGQVRRWYSDNKYLFENLTAETEGWYNQNEARIKARRVFRSRVKDRFGELSLDKVYPLYSHWAGEGQEFFRFVPPGLPLKENNLRDFTYRLFGKTAYRKDLAKAIANCPNLFTIAIAAQFKPFVPIDWIITFLRNNSGENLNLNRMTPNTRPLKIKLGQLPPRSYRRLMQNVLTYRDYGNVSDIIRLSRDDNLIYEEPVVSFLDWHDKLYHQAMRPYRLVYEPPNLEAEIPLSKIGTQLQNTGGNDWKIVIPTKVNDIFEWGKEMGNCIGSYASRVIDKNATTTLGAVYHKDKLHANFEINGNKLNQLLGKYNQSLDSDTRVMLETFIFNPAGVITEDYWGKR